MMLLSCTEVKTDISGNLSQPLIYRTDLPPRELNTEYTQLKRSLQDVSAAPIRSTHTAKNEIKLVQLFGFSRGDKLQNPRIKNKKRARPHQETQCPFFSLLFSSSVQSF